MRIVQILFITALLLGSCQNKEESNSYNGIWESIGHGQILEIKNNTDYAFYDITSISCLPSRKSNLEEIANSLVLENDTLRLLQGYITYKFTRVGNLPKLCQTSLENEKAKDPLYNFEVFMETVKEHYAFLELNEIDWDKLYRNQKGKLTATSTSVDLYLTIEETFEKLNDNHAFLEATDDVYDELEKQSVKENTTEEKLPEYGDMPVAKMVAEHYLQEEMTKDSWLIQWGKMEDNIGYIQLKAMWLFADLDLSQTLIDSIGFVDAFVTMRSKMYEGSYMEKEVEGVSKIMDRVMNDLADSKSIIIDVRFNGGGQDVVGFEILSRFNSKKIQIANDKFRYGNKHTPPLPIYLEGTKNAYTKPVYLLTSPQTGSAAESFSMATISMTNVKRIGSSTEGAMSTTLDKKLPNGWDFCVSNEIYEDSEGKSYENVGIPVHHELGYPRDRQTFFRSVANDLEKDKINILKAIEKLKTEE